MKKVLAFLIVITFVLLSGCGMSIVYEKSDQAIILKGLNDTIDRSIDDLISLYRGSNTTLEEIESSSETINLICSNIDELEEELNIFNNKYNNELDYDSSMFDYYAGIIEVLKDWRNGLIDDYGNESGLVRTFRITDNSNRAIYISRIKEIIEVCKPKYQSLIIQSNESNYNY